MTCFLQNVPVDCNDPRNYRTMWGIVYSCLLTVFACIWTAVHPDVPHSDGDAEFIGSRGGSVILSLVVPEWTLVPAWEEFVMSRRISEKYEMVEGWTSTHSYFVAMSGFFDPSTGRGVNTNELQQYPGIIENTGNTRKVAITQKQILDRSKGDAFSKFLTVLQLLWFITQYVGRWASHLHISQLETMALAYAALSLVLYVLWWDKPVNVQFPIHVTKESPSETNADQQTPKTETDADADPTSRVEASEPKGLELLYISGVAGMVFGGIHCFAWSFPFLTHTEMVLWRVSAVYITVAPAFVLWIARARSNRASNGITVFITATLVLLYATARVTLVVLTFTSLCSPPPDLYQTPSWSSFFPHFG
ncbi:uncharacterized protein EI90DRAFT_3067072 [Cantharellus anzutake]|uniref:uncharacterized protein n=1 Tax=Cantharellus anzutake TaxID=1750568 RepID=UPI0019086330|nr:uncharacterized protein EI90DRAFT_3067072 [Cantharellus anzutake]KAF8327809.1 hypothetical protein EI90DRAFT_3067072 [Cantharellus anzutake]